MFETCVTDCRSGPSDILVLIDGSLSSHMMFTKAVTFLNSMVDILEIGQNDTQIMVVVFSNEADVLFDFDDYLNKNSLLTALDYLNLSDEPTATFTHSAIERANQVFDIFF